MTDAHKAVRLSESKLIALIAPYRSSLAAILQDQLEKGYVVAEIAGILVCKSFESYTATVSALIAEYVSAVTPGHLTLDGTFAMAMGRKELGTFARATLGHDVATAYVSATPPDIVPDIVPVMVFHDGSSAVLRIGIGTLDGAPEA